jgi:uroporphyrinogen-III synthase
MRRLIVLRPEPGASETVARAEQLGLAALAIPLFEVEPVAWTAPDAGSFDGLLLTSANVVRHGGGGLESLRGLAVYAVGDATAAAAREAGFDIAATGNSGVERLLGSIDSGLRLLHVCGEDRVDVSDARQMIEQVVAYRARPTGAPNLADLKGNVVLIHSPRAARRLTALVTERASIHVAAISAAAADAVGEGWAAVKATEEPTDEALLALAERLCDNGAGE